MHTLFASKTNLKQVSVKNCARAYASWSWSRWNEWMMITIIIQSRLWKNVGAQKKKIYLINFFHRSIRVYFSAYGDDDDNDDAANRRCLVRAPCLFDVNKAQAHTHTHTRARTSRVSIFCLEIKLLVSACSQRAQLQLRGTYFRWQSFSGLCRAVCLGLGRPFKQQRRWQNQLATLSQ